MLSDSQRIEGRCLPNGYHVTCTVISRWGAEGGARSLALRRVSILTCPSNHLRYHGILRTWTEIRGTRLEVMKSWSEKGRPALFQALEAVCRQIDRDLESGAYHYG